MAILKKERIPCCSIEDKYIDALLENTSPRLILDLSLLVIITRLEKIPPLEELSELLQRPEIELEWSLNKLAEIGFLSLT
jgi:hypothetical protein